MKPIRYKVLMCRQLSAADRMMVAAKVATIFTGPEACSYSCHTEGGVVVNENWQFEVKDRLGYVVVLKYRGVDAALFYKRQTTEVEPLPVDPIPEGIIKDPADVWMRLDLLGLSARQVTSRVGKQKKGLEEKLQLATRHVAAKAGLIQELESTIFHLNLALEKKDGEIAKLKAAAKGQLVGAR